MSLNIINTCDHCDGDVDVVGLMNTPMSENPKLNSKQETNIYLFPGKNSGWTQEQIEYYTEFRYFDYFDQLFHCHIDFYFLFDFRIWQIGWISKINELWLVFIAAGK